MKRAFLSGLALAFVASVSLGGEGSTLRSALVPALVAQNTGVAIPPALSPVPDPAFSQGTTVYAPSTTGTVITSGEPLELFGDVRYHGTRNIAPCAVPTVVQFNDPCNRDKCYKSCVNVQICVPPCEPACVKVTRSGDRVRYDYGEDSVVIRKVGHHIVVHYYS